MIQHLKAIGFVSYYHDYIISVPMHRDKLKMRGYNQSQLLAKALSNHFKIPLNNDIIEVTKLRPSQTKLTKLDRTPNVEGIFRASSKAKNLNFLLVDDIFTSGATIAACSKSLKEKGANIVTVITLAKTTQ